MVQEILETSLYKFGRELSGMIPHKKIPSIDSFLELNSKHCKRNMFRSINAKFVVLFSLLSLKEIQQKIPF